MEAIAALILLLFQFPIQVFSTPLCQPGSCGTTLDPQVRFPFRLKDRQPDNCGYPGFDLYCNLKNRTTLRLPSSGEFTVDQIDYEKRAIFIRDPDSCLARRMLNFNPKDYPFVGPHTTNYTLFNCSIDPVMQNDPTSYMRLPCLSGQNYAMFAMEGELNITPACRRVGAASVAEWRNTEQAELLWSDPCGLPGDSAPRIGCPRPDPLPHPRPKPPSPRSGLPRSAKYGIIVGVGIPGVVCIIGLACYLCTIIRALSFGRRSNENLPTIEQEQPIIIAGGGLDKPTIDSYPILVLGKSLRLPEASDGTCPICLSDYEAKEILRSIPECNHYFHASCIDEWLKLNATCPLCRVSPEGSVATPCFSTTSFSSASTTSIHHHHVLGPF